MKDVVFTDQQLCQTGLQAVRELASKQQPDTTVEMQLCNFAALEKLDTNKML